MMAFELIRFGSIAGADIDIDIGVLGWRFDFSVVLFWCLFLFVSFDGSGYILIFCTITTTTITMIIIYILYI